MEKKKYSVFDEINRLWRSLKFFNKIFNENLFILKKASKTMIIPEINSRDIYFALELCSCNCIKIVYELFTNNKLDFLKKLKDHPAERLFAYKGLPNGVSIWDLIDINAINIKKRNNIPLSQLEDKTIEIFKDLKKLRDKVVCHCDPDNFEIQEEIEVIYKRTGNIVEDEISRLNLHIRQYEHRKKTYEVFIPLIESMINIINSNDLLK